MEKSRKGRLHALVSGRVQGVFYRMFVLQEAQKLRLAGRARNLADGRVEVVAEGEAESLKRLVERLRAGPRGAAVDEVDASWDDYQHEFDEFRIDY